MYIIQVPRRALILTRAQTFGDKCEKRSNHPRSRDLRVGSERVDGVVQGLQCASSLDTSISTGVGIALRRAGWAVTIALDPTATTGSLLEK